MLKRKPTSQHQETDWFQFSAGLIHGLCSDYIAMRLLLAVEPLTTAMTICPKMLEIVEKSLKLHLAVQTQSSTALTDARTEYGHNIEKLRAACAGYHSIFNDVDIQAFTKDLNDKNGKLYQYLRYGSQETTSGFETNLSDLLPVVDKIFAKSVLLLPEGPRRLLLFCSPLKNLTTRSRFDQSQHPEQLLEVLQSNNVYFQELTHYFSQLDREHEARLKALSVANG